MPLERCYNCSYCATCAIRHGAGVMAEYPKLIDCPMWTPRTDPVNEAIDDLVEDIASKPQALHNSKGGEVTMPGDDKKEPAKTETESNLPKYIATAKRILKKDHNWKYLVGMFGWWLIAKLIYG